MQLVAYILLFTSVNALKCNNDEEFRLPEINFPKDFQRQDFIKTFVEAKSVKIGERIVHGLIAEEEKRIFPYQAYLIFYYPNGIVTDCGGVILTESWVLTAGHCTFGTYYVKVGVGSNNYKKMTYQTSSVIVTHPNYNEATIQNDIGLIQLCKNLIFNEFVSAIRLPSEATCESFVGTNCTVSGFGDAQDNTTVSYEELRFTTVEIISNIEGMRIYKQLAYPTLFFTMGKNNSGPCVGDSGGPLTIFDNKTPVCIGVTSFSKAECGKYPTAYTRVDQYLPWIRKYIFGIKP